MHITACHLDADDSWQLFPSIAMLLCLHTSTKQCMADWTPSAVATTAMRGDMSAHFVSFAYILHPTRQHARFSTLTQVPMNVLTPHDSDASGRQQA